MTQIDYDPKMVFVAVIQQRGREVIIGVTRVIADPDNTDVEFAVLVRFDLKKTEAWAHAAGKDDRVRPCSRAVTVDRYHHAQRPRHDNAGAQIRVYGGYSIAGQYPRAVAGTGYSMNSADTLQGICWL